MDEIRPGASGDRGEGHEVVALPVRLFAPGTEIGRRYEVRSVLGTGGSAVVYEAFDRHLSRRVALKVLRADRTSEAALKRFRREVAIARDAASPRLVRVFDIGQAGDTIFLTMEMVDGESLRDLLARGPLPPERAVAIGAEVLRALADLHALGIVHRDVKPGNILLASSGEVKLADFGLARRWEASETRATETEAVVGTAEYLSPEQALGQPLDGRSDIYSFGVVLYEMLTGRVPLHGDSAIGTIVAHLRKAPLDLRRVRPEVPGWLAHLTARLLEKDRTRRHASPTEVLADLEARRARRPPLRLRTPLAIGLSTALLATALAVALVPSLPWNRPRLARLAPDGTGGVLAMDGKGRVLWHRQGAEAGRHLALVRGANGETAVVAVSGGLSEPRKSLDLLDPETGRAVRRMSLPDPSTAFPGFSASYDAASTIGADMDGDGIDEVAVSLRHIPLSPSATFVCDVERQRVLLAFYGSGHHYARGSADLDGDGRRELLLLGLNNRMGYSGALAALRLPRDGEPAPAVAGLVTGESPDRPTLGGSSPVLVWYSLLPATLLLNGPSFHVDETGRAIRVENPAHAPWEVAFDGFPGGARDAATSRARSASREEAYASLRETVRLRGALFPEQALAEAERALASARAAGDAPLAAWATRVHAAALLEAGRPEEADAAWGGLFARVQEASIVALEAGRAFHLEGDLGRAVAWYRRGLAGQGSRTRVGSDPRDLVGGEVLALGESGRWDDAAAEIDRFEAAYPELVVDVAALRAYVAWRTLRRPRPFDDRPDHPGLYRYWHLEVRRELGEPPLGLLGDAERLGDQTREVTPLVTSLRAELLFALGRRSEARALAAEAAAAASRAALGEVGVRAHLGLVLERARRAR